jgi:ferritin
MLNKTIQDALNEQIKNEIYSGYLYLAMAAYSESVNLGGFAHWMRAQAQEEMGHAMKMFSYINERGGRVLLQAIAQPPAEFESPLDVFHKTLEHEQHVTKLIHDLYALSLRENDYATQMFLQWFITEQVEEEKNATEIVNLLERIGGQAQGLVMLDRQLAQRGAH